MIKKIREILSKILGYCIPILKPILNGKIYLNGLQNAEINVSKEKQVKIAEPYSLINCTIGRGTYISVNCKINMVNIGKFCSIGPNFLGGWGIHPSDGISTHPYFYSTLKQNGYSIANEDLIVERKPISIGNDVFIGGNVTVLDGINIGNGAIIGAGTVVSKDIPPFAIAYGNPIEIKKYRFDKDQISKLEEIKWWDFDDDKLEDVNKLFFNINEFIKKYYKS